MAPTSTNIGQYTAKNRHMQLFIVKTSSTQISSTNCDWWCKVDPMCREKTQASMGQSWKFAQTRSKERSASKQKWWCQSGGIVFWQVLSRNTTIDAKLYCPQLENWRTALQVNRWERRKVRLLYDNARAHTAKVIRQKLEDSRWDILSHPPYWPALTALLLSYVPFAQQWSGHKTLRRWSKSKESDLEVFFSSLSKKFSENGTMNLPRRWEYVIDKNDVFVID